MVNYNYKDNPNAMKRSATAARVLIGLVTVEPLKQNVHFANQGFQAVLTEPKDNI